MPRHLYTIPSGTALPSPTTDLPEGYPFLLVADESVPGELFCLQNGTFQRMVPDPTVPVVTGTRTPVTFVGKVLTTSAGSSVPCAYEGVPAGRFVVPRGVSAAGGSSFGQLREITMCTDTTSPNALISINVSAVAPDGSPATWNPWTTWPGLVGVDHLRSDVVYDVATHALSAGAVLSMALNVDAGYTAASDIYVTVTLWFGEIDVAGTADTVSDEGEPRRLEQNAELTEREGELEKG